MNREAIQQTAEALQETLGVARVTVRRILDDGESELLAEALAAGQPTVLTVNAKQDDPNSTYQWILRERTLLVQNDLVGAQPSPPDALISVLGIRAQMLAPVLVDDEVRAVVSVHHAATPRDWAAADIWRLGMAIERLSHQV